MQPSSSAGSAPSGVSLESEEEAIRCFSGIEFSGEVPFL